MSYEGGADFHRAFLFSSGDNIEAVIEDLTITQGYEAYGGAILCNGGATPTIRRCAFTGNGAGIYGGAIYCASATPSIESCRFEGNQAVGKGGAFYGSNTTTSITGCEFVDNVVSDRGGALAVYESYITITGSFFSGNEAEDGGALSFEYGSVPSVITGCTFAGNTSSDNGGAIHVAYSPVNMGDCIFEANTAVRYGGGIYDLYGALVCQGTDFIGNHAMSGGGIGLAGAALHLHAALLQENTATNGGAICGYIVQPGFLTYCTFIGNVAVQGGGIFYQDRHSREQTIEHCTFCANDAPEAVRLENEMPLVVNNTVIFHPSIDAAVVCDGPVEVTCTDICDEALSGAWPLCISYLLGTDGNIAAEPRFCDPASWDLTLHCESPCATDPECGLMGAWPVGCGSSPAERATWGKIKAIFR